MNKQLFIIGVLLVFLLLCCSGCTDTNIINNNNDNSTNNSANNTTNNTTNTTQPSNHSNQFIGEWQERVLESTFSWIFYHNNTLWKETASGTMSNTGTWEVKNDLLCLFNKTVCYIYVFSDENNTLTLTISTEKPDFPKKIILQKQILKPSLVMTLNNQTRRITVMTLDSNTNLLWRDMDINFVDPLARYQVFYANGSPVDVVNQTSGAGNSTLVVGDYILISPLSYTGNITIYMRYIPQNINLGSWTLKI